MSSLGSSYGVAQSICYHALAQELVTKPGLILMCSIALPRAIFQYGYAAEYVEVGGQYQESQEALLAAWSSAGLAQEEPGPSRGITHLWSDAPSTTSAAADVPEVDGVGGLQSEDSWEQGPQEVSEPYKNWDSHATGSHATKLLTSCVAVPRCALQGPPTYLCCHLEVDLIHKTWISNANPSSPSNTVLKCLAGTMLIKPTDCVQQLCLPTHVCHVYAG